MTLSIVVVAIAASVCTHYVTESSFHINKNGKACQMSSRTINHHHFFIVGLHRCHLYAIKGPETIANTNGWGKREEERDEKVLERRRGNGKEGQGEGEGEGECEGEGWRRGRRIGRRERRRGYRRGWKVGKGEGGD